MAITIARCEQHITHHLRRPMSSEMDVCELANLAGEWTVSAHSWEYLKRVPASLDFVAAQEYVTLPTDFVEHISIERANLIAVFEMTTETDVVRRRQKQLWASTELAVWGAVATTSGTASAPPTARLEIFPTPSENTTGALSMVYRAGWSRLTGSDQDHAFMPTYMEPVFFGALRAFAWAWEKNESISKQLTDIAPLLLAAVRQDGSQQMDLGVIQHGAVSSQYGRYSNVSPWRLSIP